MENNSAVCPERHSFNSRRDDSPSGSPGNYPIVSVKSSCVIARNPSCAGEPRRSLVRHAGTPRDPLQRAIASDTKAMLSREDGLKKLWQLETDVLRRKNVLHWRTSRVTGMRDKETKNIRTPHFPDRPSACSPSLRQLSVFKNCNDAGEAERRRLGW
jgi:hypothetical protein